MTRRAACVAAVPLAALLLLGGCSDAGPGAGQPATQPTAPSPNSTGTTSEQRFPEILAVEASQADDGTFSFAVTISSPYDSPDRYADGWRVLGADGEVYGEMTLLHDHASEQPFTRTQTGVEIPPGVDTVEIEGRDTDHGYGGERATVMLPGR